MSPFAELSSDVKKKRKSERNWLLMDVRGMHVSYFHVAIQWLKRISPRIKELDTSHAI